MTLTDADLAYLRSELGTGLDETDAQARYDRTGSAVAVALEVVQQRLADLLADPASFTLPGVLTVGTAENIKALQAQADRLRGQLATEVRNALTDAAGAAGRAGRVRRDQAVWR